MKFKKSIIIVVVTALVLMTVGTASAATITVNNSIGSTADHTTIQAAVDNANDGDKIIVQPGLYVENIDVSQSNITIKSESGNPDDTIVQAASSNDHLFYVNADKVTISGFNLTGATLYRHATIYLDSVQHNNISNNELSKIYGNYGIYLYSSSNNTLTSNTVSGNSYGIVLHGSNNNTLTSNTASDNGEGIALWLSNNNTLTSNTASDNGDGIYLSQSSNNNLTSNTASDNINGIYLLTISNNNNLTSNTASNNERVGINLQYSSNNNLTSNTASDNINGIYLYSSSNNTLTSNTMDDNQYNFGVGGTIETNDIDTSNKVDKKQIYYLVDVSDRTLDSASKAGTIYCINCQNISIKDLILENNYMGISFWNTIDSKIDNNTISDNNYGIYLYSSSNNTLTSNTASDNYYAIYLSQSSNNNTLTSNTVSDNNYGIYLYSSNDYNTLTSNTVSGNSYEGIRMWRSNYNTLTSNTVSDNNRYGIQLLNSIENILYNNYFKNTNNFYLRYDSIDNTWSSTEKMTYYYEGNTCEGYIGNYYFDYTGTDSNRDGIGDTPHILAIINGVFYVIDKYPLMFWPVITAPPNQPPIADANGPYVGDEGSNITFDGSGSSDPDGDVLQYRWDFNNDGTWDTEWSSDPTANNTWDDDHTGEVVVEVSDGELTDTATTTVTVYNVAPNITAITMQPAEPVEIGTVVNLTTTFTDPGSMDTHNYTIDWGNDTITGPFTAISPIKDNHRYTTPGVYTINLTVTDDDGGLDTEVYQYVVVYDPEGGFVTGHGSINSPEGAYVLNPTLTGVARFGFISKYKQGQSTPTGTTQFHFQTADLTFYSEEYDWLVVNKHKAMYKGTGILNNEQGYGFIISAIDEKNTPSTDVDKFRIKIWNKETEEIVYDNGVVKDPVTGEYDYLEEDADPVTEIFNGQIVITPDR